MTLVPSSGMPAPRLGTNPGIGRWSVLASAMTLRTPSLPKLTTLLTRAGCVVSASCTSW